MGDQLAGAVLDRVPVDQPGIAGVRHGLDQPLVALRLVGHQVARDELVVQLPQGHGEALRLIFVDDGVGLFDHGERLGLEVDVDEGLFGHQCRPIGLKAG